MCCVRDAHQWTDIFWQDCQHGNLHEHCWRILCSTNRRRKTAFSSSRTGRHVTLLGCPCNEFMSYSLRNEGLANICGRHVLLTLQYATIFSGDTWKLRYTNQIRTRYRNWRTTSATQLQPSKSLCYIGYISTWLDVRSCVLKQEATTFNFFYDGLSFQHLATVFISLFTPCYGPGLLFRSPSCTSNIQSILTYAMSFTYSLVLSFLTYTWHSPAFHPTDCTVSTPSVQGASILSCTPQHTLDLVRGHIVPAFPHQSTHKLLPGQPQGTLALLVLPAALDTTHRRFCPLATCTITQIHKRLKENM